MPFPFFIEKETLFIGCSQIVVASKEDFVTCVSNIIDIAAKEKTLLAVAPVRIVPYIATISRLISHLKASDALNHLDVGRPFDSHVKDAVSTEDLRALTQAYNLGLELNERDWVL